MMEQARADKRELKCAARRLIRQAGGQKKAAAIIRRSPSQVQRYASENQPDHLDIHQVLLLERAVGDLIVTGMLAQLQGAALASLKHSQEEDSVLACYARAVAATTSASEVIAEASVRDLNLCLWRTDLMKVADKVYDVLSRWSDLAAVVHSRLDGRGPLQAAE